MSIRRFASAAEGAQFILRRRDLGQTQLSPSTQASVRRIFGEDLSAEQVVDRILDDVQAHGDAALRRYTAAIDQVELTEIEVPQAEIAEATSSVPVEVVDALRFSADRIRRFHERQPLSQWIDVQPEGMLGQLVRPLERVGIYAPGGRAPYPSSLLMTAIPAAVAGVEEIIVCAPPEPGGRIAPVTLAAARVAGVHRVFKLGGAQAVGAMAYGTESVPKVDKILGPGNIFVVLAKRQVYGNVDIDLLPGPTETLVIADESAAPSLCAADLLAQAEHDPMASAILVTTSAAVADEITAELERQGPGLERWEIAAEALETNGAIILVRNLDEAFELANDYAPEHLCLLIEQPWDHLDKVKHAGGVFLGEQSPEVLGDYTAGPSHVMPTGRTARFASPVNLLDFVKVISIIGLNEQGLREIGPAAARIARAEGLTAHAAAVERRLERIQPD